MKKIISNLLVLMFCINIFGINSSYASNNQLFYGIKMTKSNYTKNIIISHGELNKTNIGKKYIRTIDSLIDKLSNNYSKLNTVKNNLEKLNIESINDKKIKNTLTYLESKINIALIHLSEKSTEDIMNLEVSNEDNDLVNKRILKLQNNISNSSKNIIDTLTKEFEKSNNIKETGNIKLNGSINQEMLGNLDFELGFEDYVAKNYNFDSSIKGNLSSSVNGNLEGENIDFEMDTIIDMISKNGDIYIMLDKLNIISKQDIKEYEEYIEKIKKLAKENKYIRYSDSESQEAMEILNSLNLDNLKNDITKYFSKPMLKAYKKEGNKYYIKPTKYACDTIKEISNKFDPFNGSECSNSQYNKMLEDLSEMGELYMTIEPENTTLGLEGKSDNFVYNKGKIKFSDSEIISFSYNYKDQLGEANIDYISKNKLNISVKTNIDNSSIIFESKLDENNNFSYINSKLSTENSNFQLSLNNGKLDGSFSFVQSGYDYQTWEKQDKSIFSGSINGSTNNKNIISELKIDFKNRDLITEKDNLTGDFYYDDKNLSLDVEYNDDKTIFVLKSNASMDSNNILDNLDLESKLEMKKGKLDSQTYNYIYDENFSDIYDLNIIIKNKNIDGDLSIYGEENKEIINITSNGNYSKNSFNIENKMILNSDIFPELDYNIKDNNNTENITSNFNINYTKNNNLNKVNILFDTIQGNNKIINVNFDAESKTQENNDKIIKPNNFIDYDEVFEIKSSNYYIPRTTTTLELY